MKIDGGFRFRGNVSLFLSELSGGSQEVAVLIQGRAQQKAPKKTYQLADSIQAEIVRSVEPGVVRVEVFSPLPHAGPQEVGSGEKSERRGQPKTAYIVKPTNKRALALPVESSGEVKPASRGGIVIAIATVSGVPAIHYMRNAMREVHAEKLWSSILRPSLLKLLRARQ